MISTSKALTSTFTTVRFSPTYNINQQEQTGDNVEMRYTANFNACEYLNCKFNFIEGPSGDIGMSKSILADDHAYDIVYGIQWQIAPLVAKHMFMNFSDNQYIDFEKPWWFSEYIEEAAAETATYIFLQAT